MTNCEKCNGKGRVTGFILPDAWKCDACNGTGKQPTTLDLAKHLADELAQEPLRTNHVALSPAPGAQPEVGADGLVARMAARAGLQNPQPFAHYRKTAARGGPIRGIGRTTSMLLLALVEAESGARVRVVVKPGGLDSWVACLVRMARRAGVNGDAIERVCFTTKTRQRGESPHDAVELVDHAVESPDLSRRELYGNWVPHPDEVTRRTINSANGDGLDSIAQAANLRRRPCEPDHDLREACHRVLDMRDGATIRREVREFDPNRPLRQGQVDAVRSLMQRGIYKIDV